MATTTTKPGAETVTSLTGVGAPGWPGGGSAPGSSGNRTGHIYRHQDIPGREAAEGPSHRDALQALLAFAALHEQVRRRKALAARHNGFDAVTPVAEFEPAERYILDEVLQLIAERAVAITGADGLAIALAENNEIVLRAAAGTVRPDVGARIERDSAFSGACFREAQVVTCDDTETDPRVNADRCRKLGARSMIAVPLCGRRRVIGVLEAFFAWPFGFNDSDVRNLSLLAELVLGALKPEDEDRFAESAQAAATKLESPVRPVPAPAAKAPIQGPPATATPVVAKPAVAPVAPATRVVAKPVETAEKPAPAVTVSAVTKPTEAPVVPAPSVVPAKAKEAASISVSASVSATAAPATLQKEKAVELPKAVAAENVSQFESLQEKPTGSRSITFVLLVGIVIVAAFTAGVWWKIRNGQLSGETVLTTGTPTEEISPKPAGSPPDATAAISPAGAANPTASSAGSNALPDASLQTTATPQELAKFPRVSGIRHWSSADSSTVVLDLEDQVQYETHHLTGPDRIYFDLRDTQLTPELSGKSIEVGDALLNRIRVAQPVAGMTRIVLETRPNTNFSVSLETNPYRLVVEVRRMGATPKGAINLFPNAEAEKNLMAIVIPPPTKEDLQLRARVPKMRIVVDAGHGGWDLGTVGKRGLLEKDLVLEIAQRLGKLLESRLGMDVIYTRQDDNYIALDERAGIANQAQADLFVSVHANYSDLPSARGVETYYTNFFSAPGSKEVGSKDAATAQAALNGAKNAVTPALSSAELRERIEQSRRLAASVQRSLYGTLSVRNPGLRDRGIKEAGFVVLTESAMPGILAEVSFVSSPTDEQKLRSDGYREQIAEALYKGIARYAVSSKGVKMASAGR